MVKVCVGPEFCTDTNGNLILKATRIDNYIVPRSGFKVAYAYGWRIDSVTFIKFAIENTGATITASSTGNVTPDREFGVLNVPMRPIVLDYGYAVVNETTQGAGIRLGSDGILALIHFNNSTCSWPKGEFLYYSGTHFTPGTQCAKPDTRDPNLIQLTEELTLNPIAQGK